jgi:hypothetical protein
LYKTSFSSPYIRRFAAAACPKRFLFPLGLVEGVTAYAMNKYSVGGWVERSAVLFFNSVSFYSRCFGHGTCIASRRCCDGWHGAIAVLLGIATTRPLMGTFFATSRVTHLSPEQFLGIAFWIGFSINTLIVEPWLRSQEGKSQIERMAMRPFSR